jgi:hypothetical protein
LNQRCFPFIWLFWMCFLLSSAITWGIPHIDQDHLNFIMTSDVFDHAGCLDSQPMPVISVISPDFCVL